MQARGDTSLLGNVITIILVAALTGAVWIMQLAVIGRLPTIFRAKSSEIGVTERIVVAIASAALVVVWLCASTIFSVAYLSYGEITADNAKYLSRKLESFAVEARIKQSFLRDLSSIYEGVTHRVSLAQDSKEKRMFELLARIERASGRANRSADADTLGVRNGHERRIKALLYGRGRNEFPQGLSTAARRAVGHRRRIRRAAGR